MAFAIGLFYSPHGYDIVVDTEYYDNPGTDRTISIFEACRRAQQRLDVPVLVGEWGGEHGGRRWIAHCEALLDLFDAYGWSNTFYAWRRWGRFEINGMDFLARPYPMAVNGRDIAYKYDKATGTFILEFTQAEASDQPTIIYLPKEGAIEAGNLAVEIVEIGHERSMPGARYVYLIGGTGRHRVTVMF